MARGETIAGLDIGTTKTCAVIAASGPDGLEIIGVGEAPSTGMRKGVVTDLEATVHAIEAATEKAERMAGVHVSHVYVGVTGEHMQSTNNRAVLAGDGADPAVVGRLHVLAGDADVDVRDVDPGHPLGLFGRSLDRVDRRLEVGDDPFAHPGRGRFADPDDLEAVGT